jgi:serine acetyltransferase
MALVLADRVKETTTTAGTGTVTLLGAVTGFQSFAVIGNANTTYYTITARTGTEWEVGIGTYTLSGTTLARTTVLANSAGTQPTALTFSAGTKDVFVTYPSSKSVNLDASGNATALGTPAAFVGTNITGTASGLTAGNVTTNANLTGDVTSVGNATSIAAGVIVNADINASAAIVDTKLATISTALKVSNSATTATNANTASAIVARDASGNFSAGTITASLTGNASTVTTNANLTGMVTSVGNATTVVTNANLTGDVTSVGNATAIAAGVIVDADINASAGIVDTKLATISTASKVSNSATTATSANTASAIVARDASGNFTAGTITAALTGTASGNLVSGGALGTPSSGTLTNCTFPTLNQNTSGSAATVTGNATGSTFGFNSGYGSVTTVYGCRAWATFNGTTSPATLNASGGITSMTKNSTGNYTVNFSFTFPDANYAAYFGVAGGGGGGNASFVGTVVTTTQYGAPTNKTTTVCQIQTNDYTSTPRDFTQAYVAFIR